MDNSIPDFNKTTVERMYDKLKRLTDSYTIAEGLRQAYRGVKVSIRQLVAELEADSNETDETIDKWRAMAGVAGRDELEWERISIELSQKMIDLNDRIQNMG